MTGPVSAITCQCHKCKVIARMEITGRPAPSSKDDPLKGTNGLRRAGVIEFGMQCPVCRAWAHFCYTSEALEAQKAKARQLKPGSRRHQELARKINRQFNELQAEMANP